MLLVDFCHVLLHLLLLGLQGCRFLDFMTFVFFVRVVMSNLWILNFSSHSLQTTLVSLVEQDIAVWSVCRHTRTQDVSSGQYELPLRWFFHTKMLQRFGHSEVKNLVCNSVPVRKTSISSREQEQEQECAAYRSICLQSDVQTYSLVKAIARQQDLALLHNARRGSF